MLIFLNVKDLFKLYLGIQIQVNANHNHLSCLFTCNRMSTSLYELCHTLKKPSKFILILLLHITHINLSSSNTLRTSIRSNKARISPIDRKATQNARKEAASGPSPRWVCCHFTPTRPIRQTSRRRKEGEFSIRIMSNSFCFLLFLLLFISNVYHQEMYF